jgi:hypothetical protein
MPKTIATFIVLAAVFAATSATAPQTEATRAETIARSLARLNADRAFYDVIIEYAETLLLPAMRTGVESALKRQLSSSDLEKLKSVIRRTALDVFPVKPFEDALTPVYTEHFTATELESLIAFYGTSLGQKLFLVTPLLTQASVDT